MKKAIFILALVSSVCSVFSASLREDAEKAMRTFYGENISLTFSKMQLDKETKNFVEKSAKQKFKKDFVYFWTIEKKQFEYSFAILDQVKAKSAIITVLTTFDRDGVVEHVNIIKYTGDKGRAVMDDHWLGQFEGKDSTSDFNMGTGVDGMTGATFSASTIIRGVHKWSLLVDTLKEKCELPVH